jgi:hypothetical protein
MPHDIVHIIYAPFYAYHAFKNCDIKGKFQWGTSKQVMLKYHITTSSMTTTPQSIRFRSFKAEAVGLGATGGADGGLGDA